MNHRKNNKTANTEVMLYSSSLFSKELINILREKQLNKAFSIIFNKTAVISPNLGSFIESMQNFCYISQKKFYFPHFPK